MSSFIRIGFEISVSAIFHRLKHQEGVSRQLNAAAQNLRSLADLIETVKPAAELLIQEGGAK